MKIIESISNNPIYNIAFEEALFEEHDSEELVLFLYSNTDSVIIGRHQNPWRECPNVLTSFNDTPLIRRFTGGGSVFHDLGNLNICLIGPKNCDDDILTDLIMTPLKMLNLDVKYVKSYGDLLLRDAKISGRAHYYKKNKSIHHATLLVNSNLEKLKKSLRRDYLQNFETNAIPSRVAKSVCNLNTIRTYLTVTKMKELILKYAYQFYSVSKYTDTSSIIFNSSDLLKRKQQRHLDPEWIYGKSPYFFYNLTSLNNEDAVYLPKVLVKNGYIVDFIDISESLKTNMSKKILGRRFNIQELNHVYYQFQINNKKNHRSQII